MKRDEKPPEKGESELWYAGGVIGFFLMLLAGTLWLATRCTMR